MKCIHCGRKSSRLQRRGGRCPACSHVFAFDPERDRFAMSDADFHAAIQSVSAGGRLFFGARQLWDELNRRRPATGKTGFDRFVAACTYGGMAAGAALGVLNVTDVHVLMLILLGMMAGLGVPLVVKIAIPEIDHTPPPLKIPYHVFRAEYLNRWTAVHGPIVRLLPGPEPVPAPAAAAVPREVPADVAAFSFDRVVVTQHADTAAMLVANRFHFEHACAVLSLDGYPSGIAETVKGMLRRNPRLTVFALHDASAAGVKLPFTLREPAWFPERTTLIVDAGLRTGRPDRSRRALLPPLPVRQGPPVTLPKRVREALPAADVAWFEAGNRAELAALRPEQIMQMLQRAFTATGLPGQPAHVEATRLAAAGAGFIAVDSLPAPASDTAAADGFG